jgi:hypothetical protein
VLFVPVYMLARRVGGVGVVESGGGGGGGGDELALLMTWLCAL